MIRVLYRGAGGDNVANLQEGDLDERATIGERTADLVARLVGS